MIENVTNKVFFVFLKFDLNALECHFLCVIHGPQNCIKWSKNAFRCWNLCFHMIVWCFNSIDTIHLFLWEKTAPFGCGIMARLWVQTTGFGVCLWQSVNNSPSFSDSWWPSTHIVFRKQNNVKTPLSEMTLLASTSFSDSWWPSTHIVFRKQNNVKTPLSEMTLLASQYIETVWRNFLHVSWTVSNKF